MKKLLSIGEISRLMNISSQTFRYYDRIGLLKPEYIDEDNNYRYYSINQIDQLITIRHLKHLGMDLDQIKEFMYNQGVSEMQQVLYEQQNLVKKRIEELLLEEKFLEKKHQLLTETMNIKEDDVIGIKRTEEREAHTIKMDNDDEIGLVHSVEESIQLENFSRIFGLPGAFAVSISIDNLFKGEYNNYEAILLIPDKNEKILPANYKLPAGEYAWIYHRGTYDNISESYEQLLKYIKSHSYSITGSSVELCLIGPPMTGKHSEYLTEIQIPVKKV